jgi:hypothetical protein
MARQQEQGSGFTDPGDRTEVERWDGLPLFEALRSRRSRRFGLGMRMDGPLSFESRHDPVPLTEQEQAILAFAASGITGYALNDMTLGIGQGGSMMSGLVGRTVASADAVQSVALLVTDDTGTWLLRRPQDLDVGELADVIDLSGRGDVVGMYRLLRVQLSDQRARIPQEPPGSVSLNRWSLNAPGSTYFLPIRDVGYVMINGMLEFLNEDSRLFVVDERATYRPAGLRRFSRRRGGHLEDDLRLGRTVPGGARPSGDRDRIEGEQQRHGRVAVGEQLDEQSHGVATIFLGPCSAEDIDVPSWAVGCRWMQPSMA